MRSTAPANTPRSLRRHQDRVRVQESHARTLSAQPAQPRAGTKPQALLAVARAAQPTAPIVLPRRAALPNCEFHLREILFFPCTPRNFLARTSKFHLQILVAARSSAAPPPILNQGGRASGSPPQGDVLPPFSIRFARLPSSLPPVGPTNPSAVAPAPSSPSRGFPPPQER